MREKPKYRMGTGEKVFLSVMIGMPLLGILSAVAIPAILNQRNKVKVASEVPTQTQGPTGQAPPTLPLASQSLPAEPAPSSNEAPNGPGHGGESLQELGLPADLVPTVPITSLVEILPRPELVYPTAARAARVQGTVLVEVDVSAEGYPISAVSQNGPIVLREVAERWQMKRRFQPPVIEGRNKPVKVMNTVNFTLEETPAPQATTTKPAMASLVQPVAPPDSATRILSQAPAAYPVNARQSQAETSREHIVRLRIRVDESGQPVGWMLMQSLVTENGFIDAARDAAMKSKYSPAMKGGRPMSDWVPVTYTFSKQSP